MKNMKKPTPLVRVIPQTGGGFYTFTSAAEDLTLSFSDFNTNKKFRFSKFALLNIPNIANRPEMNTLKLNAQPSTYLLSTFNKTTDNNIHFMHSFQNYCLNLESQILSDANYDCSLDDTVSERVFFKWLKELAGIRFQKALDSETSSDLFMEENTSDNYNRVVQYIGEISYAGNQIGQDTTFNEVYINIPQTAGHQPVVLFKNLSDWNYKPGKFFQNIDINDNLNNEIICGRTYNTIHPDGLDIRAHFDCDDIVYSGTDEDKGLRLYKKISITSDNTDGDPLFNPDEWTKNLWWYGETQTAQSNTYYLENTQFNNEANDVLYMYKPGDYDNQDELAVKFKRSRLDGITIDWNLSDYKQQSSISNLDGINNIKTIHELSTIPQSTDFEFNTILLYYDIYETSWDSVNQKMVENIKTTNLFGVLFLDNVTNLSNGEAEIKRFYKQKVNDAVNISGNEFAFKINLKIDTNTSAIDVTHIPVIAENNTLAMNIFHEALVELVRLSDYITNNQLTMKNLQYQLNELKKTYNNLTTESLRSQLNDIENRLSQLENLTLIDGVNTYANSYEKLINMFTENNRRLENFISNGLSGNMLVDLSTIRKGNGIDITKNGNSIIISTNTDNYNFSDESVFDTSNLLYKQTNNTNDSIEYYEYKLLNGNNYIYFNDDSLEVYNTKNRIHIYINDSKVKWKNGQNLRINFKTPILMTGYTSTQNISIYTGIDENNKYQQLIYNIDSVELNKYMNMPILDIHCVQNDNGQFEYLVDIF